MFAFHEENECTVCNANFIISFGFHRDTIALIPMKLFVIVLYMRETVMATWNYRTPFVDKILAAQNLL